MYRRMVVEVEEEDVLSKFSMDQILMIFGNMKGCRSHMDPNPWRRLKIEVRVMVQLLSLADFGFFQQVSNLF